MQRNQCSAPESWILCKERCSRFIEQKCAEGKSIPPMIINTTPELMCDVGGKIPYSEEHMKSAAALRVFRRELYIKHGIAVPDYLRE